MALSSGVGVPPNTLVLEWVAIGPNFRALIVRLYPATADKTFRGPRSFVK
jgi:hypothetical protein